MTKRSTELGGLTLADGRYTITATLGEGGMGSVYRAFDRNIESDVVIKVPRPAMMEDPEFAARFTREIRSLVKLSHPHIVKVSDVGMHENSPFAVMQFLPAGSLEDRLPRDSRGKPIPGDPKQVPGWLDAIAKALDYIHGRGYIHRDVKPGNILFDAEGHAFLSDFGVAKVLATSVDKEGTQAARTGTGMVLGTPEYMAPELIMGEPVDGRVDQYALAVTVYEYLCGRRPFENETKTKVLVLHTSKAPPLLTEWQPALPDRLVQAVMKGLAKDPNDRYPNCAGLAAAVAAAAAGAIAPAVEERVRFKCPQCGKKGAMPAGEYARLRQRGGRPSCPGCKVPLDEVSASAEYSPRTGSTSVFREVAGAEGGYALAPEPEVVRGGTFVMAAPKSHGEKPTDPEPRPSPGLKPALDAVYREAKAKASTELYPSAKAFAATVMDFVRSTVATARAATARPPERPGNRPSPPPGRRLSKIDSKNWDDLPPPGHASGAGQPPEPWFRPSHLVGTGVAVALLAIAIGLWATGVFRVRTADGTLVVQVNEPSPDVYVDGEKVTVAWQNGGVKAEIGVKPGTRKVELKKDGFSVFGEEVTLEDHGRTVLVARLEPIASRTPTPIAPTPPFDATALKAVGEIGTAARRLYLSDLGETEWSGHDEFGKNGTSKVGAIAVNGINFPKGLWTHPRDRGSASVKYQLAGLDATAFVTKVALNDSALPKITTPLTFQVLGDGEVLWTSAPTQQKGELQECQISVKGVRVLELRVDCPGWYDSAHAVWLDPYLLFSNPPEAAPVAEKPKPPADSPPAAIVEDLAAAKSVVFADVGSRAGEERDDNVLKLKLCWCPTGAMPGFWMGKYEVTQSEWARLMGSMPSQPLNKGQGDWHPIYSVSLDDAMAFCRKLTDLERKEGRLSSGWEYRIPTDVQWKYACRAGTTTATAFGDKLSSRQANFNGDWPHNGAPKGPNLGKSVKVGSYRPNAWGIYDMHGNVKEFTTTAGRVRGGSWCDSGRNCCSEIWIPDPPSGLESVGFAWLESRQSDESFKKPVKTRSTIAGRAAVDGDLSDFPTFPPKSAVAARSAKGCVDQRNPFAERKATMSR